MVGKPFVGTDLRALSYEECVELANEIKQSLAAKRDSAVVPQLRKNLAIVENYIARTYGRPKLNSQRPLSLNESRWST